MFLEASNLHEYLPLHKRRDRTSLEHAFFNDTATTEIYTLSLHDALPIYKAIQESVGALLRRVHLRDAYAPEGERSRPSGGQCGGQFRITGEPGAAVPGHVELGHHADAAVPCISHDLANLVLRVIVAVG